jgi:hypothetical protein
MLVRADGRRTSLGLWLWRRRFRFSMWWWRRRKQIDRLWCQTGVILRMRNPEACRGCGRTDLDGWDPTGADTWCPDCCPDHAYQHDRMRSGRWCIHCGEPEPF